MEALEQQILELIARAYDAIGWPGVVVLMTIESVFFPIPSEAVMPLAGWMLIEAQGHSVWFVLLAGLFGALGSLIGAIAIYAIGLFGGRPLLEKYGRYVLISRNDLDVADRWFERYGTWAVFTSRLLPVARSLISLPAGIARMHLLPFLVLTFLGSFIWSTGLALGGYLLGSNWEASARPYASIRSSHHCITGCSCIGVRLPEVEKKAHKLWSLTTAKATRIRNGLPETTTTRNA